MTPRKPSLRVDLVNGTSSSGKDLPPIAALFIIHFDIKAGYTIVWKKCAPGVDLEGVEFKSLPSGLHNLKEDLIYFIHQNYAGISAFINVPASAEHRNALMLCVGALVPLSYGRLGRSWRHAQNLKDMAKTLSEDAKNTKTVEEYYNTYHMEETDSPTQTPTTPRQRRSSKATRHRSASDATGIIERQTLSPYHPALSLPEYVMTFGPLIFPLYRAALTRKRILLITEAPVETPCNFVYNISILSNIPSTVADLLVLEPSRLRPLFNLGVHDIPALEEDAKRLKGSTSAPSNESTDDNVAGSWVATTTDGVLYIKKDLYDVVIRMPPSHNNMASERVWPRIEYSRTGEEMRATQRDLNRYRALRHSLRRYIHPEEPFMDDDDVSDNDNNVNTQNNTAPSSHVSRNNTLNRRSSIRTMKNYKDDNDDASSSVEESVCEKRTWPQLAYTSFLWWASAGEHYYNTAEEDSEGLEADTSANDDENDNHTDTSPLIMQQPPIIALSQQRRRSTTLSLAGFLDSNGALGNAEMDIIAYFHRMTTRILGTLAELVDASSQNGDEPLPSHSPLSSPTATNTYTSSGGNEAYKSKSEVVITTEDMLRLGLDQFSENDEKFVKELTEKYFEKQVAIEKLGLTMCGIKFC